MRSKAFFINGGAGRVLCSIPALEKYAEANPGDDFIIVCESGTDFYRGHPELHKRAFDHWHKGLFQTYLKDRDLISPEPYRLWEYYNQKCNLSQAFDIIINNQGIRELPKPTLILNKHEAVTGYNVVKEIERTTGLSKTLVIQPFGRGVQNTGEFVIDPGSRSFNLADIVEIVNELRKEYSIIMMGEFPITLSKTPLDLPPVAMPQITDIRVWASIIEASNHFLGCDSVGQHIAYALGKTATVVCGATYPKNISYPEADSFDIIDLGKNKRVYVPIRVSMDDERDRVNDNTMDMDPHQQKEIISKVKGRLGPSSKQVIESKQHKCCNHNQQPFTFTPAQPPQEKLVLAADNTPLHHNCRGVSKI